ncbi:MAG: acetyl-CoA carboxylase carboxyl transferase subunit beta [Chloroflexi bacterium]|nr:acetyl-CoA carboxylase carboxyl transferase subunit beta [Chloroflexota bacterium]|tara:strand:+ start:18851 stop:20653 length:1803 start_codon:yes stop_codon:yes gene_type:complete
MKESSRPPSEKNGGISSHQNLDSSEPEILSCVVCNQTLENNDKYDFYKICPTCNFHFSISARARIEQLADPGSFKEINQSLISLDPIKFSSRNSYKDAISHNQTRTGLTEATVTGKCSINGSPVMLIILDFGFMGGSMGNVVGEKIALAFEQATKKNLPVISVITSGGTRIEEGMISLMQMSKTALSANIHNKKGLPFITILANPSTGQAYGSFANLADIILAEPGAILGFSPLGIIQQHSSKKVSTDSHTSESHLKHGLLDAIIDRNKLREISGILLDLLGPNYQITKTNNTRERNLVNYSTQAWNSVQIARHKNRPTSKDYISKLFMSFVELHGDRIQEDDNSIITGFGRLDGQTIAVIAQESGRGKNSENHFEGRTSPAGFRKAQRLMKLATKFNTPLITLIDTPGPRLSTEAESNGLGNIIASTIKLISELEVPTLSIIIGEGGSAAALSLSVTDRVMMLENAIYTALSPEEAAELLFQDQQKAKDIVESLKLTSKDCENLGIADIIIPEPRKGAHSDHNEAARELRIFILEELTTLNRSSSRRLIRQRMKKFRNVGNIDSRLKSLILKEANTLEKIVSSRVASIRARISNQVKES